MYDFFNRRINYLRISVTDRCNLRCLYCMPEEGIQLISHADILSYEYIIDIVKFAVRSGINKVRITGGEPLVRKGICGLVASLSSIDGLNELTMTTNGLLLGEFAGDLKRAGLHRINVSLDTVDPERFSLLTRGGNIRQVLEGIEAAREAGLLPIKINCVVRHSKDETDARGVQEYCDSHDLKLRFIHQMDLQNGTFSMVDGGDGGRCETCNRLRLTANGLLKPCLFNDLAFDVRELGIEKAFQLAVSLKPEKGSHNCSGHFYNIGG